MTTRDTKATSATNNKTSPSMVLLCQTKAGTMKAPSATIHTNRNSLTSLVALALRDGRR